MDNGRNVQLPGIIHEEDDLFYVIMKEIWANAYEVIDEEQW